MEFLEAHHPEWLNMWAQLADYPINKGDAQCPCMGTSWEYMGSTENHHNFRHRKHPATGKAEYIYIERPRMSVRWAQEVNYAGSM